MVSTLGIVSAWGALSAVGVLLASADGAKVLQRLGGETIRCGGCMQHTRAAAAESGVVSSTCALAPPRSSCAPPAHPPRQRPAA